MCQFSFLVVDFDVSGMFIINPVFMFCKTGFPVFYLLLSCDLMIN